ncbi:MAG: hypothetical protein ABID04_02745, partial [Patescibacteria group bacterium]
MSRSVGSLFWQPDRVLSPVFKSLVWTAIAKKERQLMIRSGFVFALRLGLVFSALISAWWLVADLWQSGFWSLLLNFSVF